MDNIIDLRKARRENRNKNIPKNYLLAEEIINSIKVEYIGLLTGSIETDYNYKELWREFESLEYDLTELVYNELHERLNMSLLAIKSIYSSDEKDKEEAEQDFQIQFEIIGHIQMDNFEFKQEYEKSVREEWADE